ncbi:MAG: hypothetical protein GY805_17230, partial [Chloroflexi bacterium]|nr:hypothetical protein [Chloroflexota bacterium]
DIGVVTLRNQISIKVDSTQSSMFGTNGDSGSVVVDDNNNVVGLYFAGSTDGKVGIANHIGPVLDAMNVSICTEPKSILKDIIDTKYKDFIKEKEWLKDWKEKDFFENLIPNLPFDPRNAQAGSAQPASYQGVQAPSALQGQAQPVRPQAANCIDFSSYPPSIDPNPRTEGTMTFEVFQYNGTPHANTRIDNWGGIQGLNCGYRLNIALSNPCTKVDLTLAHFVTQASVRGVNVDGSTVGPVSMTVGQATPETITLQGPALRQIIVESPQNEVLLTTICCEDGGVIKKLEKEWIKLEKNELKEIKSEKIEFKEWKEIEWDHKLFKDIKDSFEGPGGQLPFDPRQAANVAGQSTSTPSSSLLEERLARLEAALSQLTHFIDPALRPDLQKGALKREADQ